MTVHNELLDSLGLEYGAAPMTTRQFQRRLGAYQESIWPAVRRQDPDLAAEYVQWMTDHAGDIAEAKVRLVFNGRLAAYRSAAERLSRVQLSVGREAQYETRETGELDPVTFEPLTEEVLVTEAVEPLPAMVEQEVRDPDTNEVTGSEEVPNPAIVKDDEERAAAQAVVDAMPDEIKTFDQA